MKLSVVILNYNVRYFLALCLKSIQEAIKTIDAEIIVVDNNSTDGSPQMIKQQFPKVHLIDNTENFGFSKGNNIGVAKAKGAYICILNPDTVVAEDTFIKLLKFADTKNNLGIIGCKLIDGKGHFLPESKRNIPKPIVALKKILGDTKSYYADTVKENDIDHVEILPGAFMLIKKETYKKIKGFDEDYFMYGEDIDLSYTILKHGYNNYYYGKTTVIHYKGESTLKDKTYAKRFYKAMQIFYKKHFKSNLLFDAIVKLTTQIIPLLSHQKQPQNNTPKHYVLLSHKNYDTLKTIVKYKLNTTCKIETYKKNTCYIFDSNSIDFKTIINMLSKHTSAKAISYRILVKDTCFLIGSDSNLHQGEVIHF